MGNKKLGTRMEDENNSESNLKSEHRPNLKSNSKPNLEAIAQRSETEQSNSNLVGHIRGIMISVPATVLGATAGMNIGLLFGFCGSVLYGGAVNIENGGGHFEEYHEQAGHVVMPYMIAGGFLLGGVCGAVVGYKYGRNIGRAGRRNDHRKSY